MTKEPQNNKQMTNDGWTINMACSKTIQTDVPAVLHDITSTFAGWKMGGCMDTIHYYPKSPTSCKKRPI